MFRWSTFVLKLHCHQGKEAQGQRAMRNLLANGLLCADKFASLREGWGQVHLPRHQFQVLPQGP